MIKHSLESLNAAKMGDFHGGFSPPGDITSLVPFTIILYLQIVEAYHKTQTVQMYIFPLHLVKKKLQDLKTFNVLEYNKL